MKFKGRIFAIVCCNFAEQPFTFTEEDNKYRHYIKNYLIEILLLINKEPSFLLRRSILKFRMNFRELETSSLAKYVQLFCYDCN